MLHRRLTSFLSGIALVGCGGRTGGDAPASSSEASGTPVPESSAPAATMRTDAASWTSDGASTPNDATSWGASEGATSSLPVDETTNPDSTTTASSERDGGVATQPPVVDPSPPVCDGQCGNAVIDTCEVCGEWLRLAEPTDGAGLPIGNIARPPDEPVCTQVAEQCDGALSHEQTCTALGFSGGALKCNDACRYDDADCYSCLTGPEEPLCRDDLSAGAAAPTFVALATNGTDLVAAWNEGCEVKVGWFDEQLDLLQSTVLDGAPCVMPSTTFTLAPIADRWLVEVGARQFIVDASGSVALQRDIVGTALFAAPRPGESPLVVRGQAYPTVTASLLDETGAEVWTRELPEPVIEARYGSATAVSDGFLVALRTDAGVQVYHLDETLGTIVGVSTPGTATTEYPQIHASSGQVRLVWTEFGETTGVQWAKLSEQGQRIGEAHPIASTPDFFNRSPILVDGEDTVVVLGGYTGITGVGQATHARRLDAAGMTTSGDVAIQADPNGVQWPQVVPFDGAFVTAWVGNGPAGRVGLARLEL